MTPDEILAITTPHDDYPMERTGAINLPLLGIQADLRVMGPREDLVVTDEMARDLSDLVSVPPDKLPALEDLLSRNCDNECRYMGYEGYFFKGIDAVNSDNPL